MKIKSCVLFFILLFSVNLYASSPIFLKITKNFKEKADISILFSQNKDNYWEKLVSVLGRDLEYSGYFSVNESIFMDNISVAKKKYTTQILLLGDKLSDGVKISIEDRLDEKLLFEKNYKKTKFPHILAHKICNDIMLHLTGKPGIAESKILFVSDSSGKYQIYQIDYDGDNLTKLTNSEFLVHYPKWLTPYKEILLISYKDGWPKLVKKNILTGVETILLAEPGLNACASPCKKTEEMAVVLSKTGHPEIYITDFNGKILKRVTYSKTTDASPSLSPSGKMIAFVSDRQGTAQVYTMTRDGTKIKRISYVSGYSTSPSWSPDGTYIAYVFMKAGNFGIAIYDVSSGETKIVSETLGSEEISWAPDSRHIVYSDIKRRPHTIMVIDILTGDKRRITSSKYNAFSPNWSPF